MYRVAQFFQAVLARVSSDELMSVAPLLGARGITLFKTLSRGDRRHSLDVYHQLEGEGCRDAVLLTAALLHDVGKSVGGLSLPHRVAAVLLRVCCPRLLAQLEEQPGFWLLRPFYAAGQHPRIGAEMVTDAGFSADVADLVRLHHAEADAGGGDLDLVRRLAVLRRADGMN